MFSRIIFPTARMGSRFVGRRTFATNARTVNSSLRSKALVGCGIATTVGCIALSQQTFADETNWNDVRAAIADILDCDCWDDGSLGPVFVRLAWHASGTWDPVTQTGGSGSGASMRFDPELNWGANAGLIHAQRKLECIKARFPEVSYADLWSLAAVVSIEEMGGPKVNWRPGRKDCANNNNCPPACNLPDAALGAQHIRDVFCKRMGFSEEMTVALIGGGHTIGRCHTDRSGFDGPWTNAPTTFSNLFFLELMDNQWHRRNWNGPMQYQDSSNQLMMLPADMALRSDPKFKQFSENYKKDEAKFFKDFSVAFERLLELGVKFEDNKQSSWSPFVLAAVMFGMSQAK